VAYVILLFRGGVEIEARPSAVPQAQTIKTAQEMMGAQRADFAKILHRDTGVVIWEGTSDAKGT
jgi:hypothetical protein